MLYVMDSDGADLTAVPPDQGTVYSLVGWAPDGRILFRGVLDGNDRVFSMRPDGSDVQVALGDLPIVAPVALLDWSGDRRWIAMSEPWQSTRDEMYLMSADGDEVFYLGGGSEPRWRPGPG
jgi:Tol biopolymer transport system component